MKGESGLHLRGALEASVIQSRAKESDAFPKAWWTGLGGGSRGKEEELQGKQASPLPSHR